MDKLVILDLIGRINRLEIEWEKIADPQFTRFGNISFHKPNDTELFRLNDIMDEQRDLRKRLLNKIGYWNYFKYKMNPIRFIDRL